MDEFLQAKRIVFNYSNFQIIINNIRILFQQNKIIDKTTIEANTIINSIDTQNDDKSKSDFEPYYKRARVIVKSLVEFKFIKIKRENIDKRVISFFRKCIFHRKLNPSGEMSKLFGSFKLTPPFYYKDLYFKSVNASYLNWLFRHEDIRCLYYEFIDTFFEDVILKLNNAFVICEKDENTMISYLKSLPEVYSS